MLQKRIDPAAWLGNAIPAEPTKVSVLVSYAYMREIPDEILGWLFANPYVEWLLDCGAFSALNAGFEISLADYMAFVQRWKHLLFGYIALDKLGDPKQTDENLRVMLVEGLQPIPVHVRGDDGHRMDFLFQKSDLVAFGGLRRPHVGSASIEYVKQKMMWARGRSVHWLGYTNDRDIRAFRPFSCDCSTVTSSARYGVCYFYLGNGRFDALTKNEFRVSPTVGRVEAVRAAGYSYSDLMARCAWRAHRSVMEYVCCMSYVRYALDLRRSVGTRVFLAVVRELHAIWNAVNRTVGINNPYKWEEYKCLQ